MIETLGKNETIEEYFSKEEYISQSTLKNFLKGYDYMNSRKELNEKYFDEPKEYLIIGSALDTLFTCGREAFEEKYHISTLVSKPSDKTISMCQYLFATLEEAQVEISKSLVVHEAYFEAVFQYHDYQPKWGEEAKNRNFLENATLYWEELVIATKKQILTLENLVLINRMEEVIKENPFIREITESPDWKVAFQVPLYGNSEDGIPIKGLLDILAFNIETQKTYIIDLKAIGDTIKNFPKLIFQRGLDFQVSFYKYILMFTETKIRDFFPSLSVSPLGGNKFRNYPIHTGFIAISYIYPSRSQYFQLEEAVYEKNRLGSEKLYQQFLDISSGLFKYKPIQGKRGIRDLLKIYETFKNTSSSFIDFYTSSDVLLIDEYGKIISQEATEDDDEDEGIWVTAT